MKTKKITALVLAAVMAAGTTATAFADCDVINAGGNLDDKRPLTFNDETIYENEDGVLTPSTDFRPGDTLYIRLDELNSNGDKKIEDEKDDMKVYADWKVGKDAVESIDIVYKKGEASVNGIVSYTVEVGGRTFTIEAKDKRALTDLIVDVINEQIAKDPNFLADEIAAQKATHYVESGLQAAGGTIYTSVEDFGAGENFTEPEKLYVADADVDAVTGQGLFYDEKNTWKNEVADPSEYLVKHNKGNFYDFMKKSATMADVDAAGYATLVYGKYIDENGTDISATIDDVAEHEAVVAAAQAAAADAGFNYDTAYTYWVEIKTKEDDTTKVLDLAGVLRIGSTKNKAEDATNEFQLDTSMDNRVYAGGVYVTVEDEWTFAPDSRSVVKFSDDAEDVVLYFGENEAAWFEFDARGQSALNLEFTFDFNKEIADLFPEANIDFLTFTSKPATNRTGDLYIVADEDTYLYEVTDDGVKTVAYLPAGGTGSAAVSAALGVKNINGAEYDEKEGAWHIRTRKLGAYAISDTELDTSRTLDGDESSSESGNSGNNNGTKPIPDTGR
ncbi:MAG TPA: hypothetical protein H9678_04205 [Firmicutes bacterium]|nr:hypothetical protein [Bacillota bacterium]